MRLRVLYLIHRYKTSGVLVIRIDTKDFSLGQKKEKKTSGSHQKHDPEAFLRRGDPSIGDHAPGSGRTHCIANSSRRSMTFPVFYL